MPTTKAGAGAAAGVRRARLAAAVVAPLLAAATLLGGAVTPASATGTVPATPPTEEQVRAQEQEAERLEALTEARAGDTAHAKAVLSDLATRASVALEAYDVAAGEERIAREAAAQARAEEEQARERRRQAEAELARIVDDVDTSREQLGDYAAAAYRSGGMPDLRATGDLLRSGDVTEVGRSLSIMKIVGARQGKAVDRLEQARARQSRVTAEAKRAAADAQVAAVRAGEQEDAARAAADRAAVARAQADALVAAQQDLVADLQQATADTAAAAEAADEKARKMAQAREIHLRLLAEAEARRRAELAAGHAVNPIPTAFVGGSEDCPGQDVSGFPNGKIPASALCRLWGAGGHMLRADAAAGFNAMSKAYAAEFGRPLCITDSYRSLEVQIDLKRRKPFLAARPGTSNHGWGKAIDACEWTGGSRSGMGFTTRSYLWMKANAPRYGWYHPSWAEPGGSKPEAWHWEFGG